MVDSGYVGVAMIERNGYRGFVVNFVVDKLREKAT